MKHFLFTVAIGASLLGIPMLSGCDKDKDTSTSKDVKTNADGSKTESKTSVTTDKNTGAVEAKTDNTTKDANGNKTVDKTDVKKDAAGNVIKDDEKHETK